MSYHFLLEPQTKDNHSEASVAIQKMLNENPNLFFEMSLDDKYPQYIERACEAVLGFYSSGHWGLDPQTVCIVYELLVFKRGNHHKFHDICLSERPQGIARYMAVHYPNKFFKYGLADHPSFSHYANTALKNMR